jgi:hypothetical protein
VTFWAGNNHSAEILRVEPLDQLLQRLQDRGPALCGMHDVKYRARR